MAATEQTAKVFVNDLKAEHLVVFNCTLSNILSTKLAERTFAQIIDGLPTRDDVGYFPTYNMEICDNTTSSPEAMEAARGLRGQFITYSSLVDAKVSPTILFLKSGF
jgi:hypothetical protein